MNEELKRHLDSLILAVLAAEPAHGYAILQELKTRSGGAFDLPEGTIYPALHRLEHRGVVTSQREVIAGRERRVYRLTARGRTALEERRAGWSDFSVAVNLVLGVNPA